jgi:glycosyltransferase involved in cell wall biosynthesis
VQELISVIITCDGQARFLPAAIHSARESTSHPVEVLVVDHGSDPEVAAAAQAFPEATYVRASSQANRARARNLGLRESRGDLLVFLDACDRLAPGALDLSIAALRAHPQCYFVSARGQRLSDGGVLLSTAFEPVIQRDHYRELLRRNYITRSANVLFRRRAVEQAGGFDPSLAAALNYDLYLRIARVHPVLDQGHVVSHYRYRRNAGDTARMLRETVEVHCSERHLLEGDEESIAACAEGLRICRDYYGTRLVNEIRLHVHAGQWISALTKSVVLGCYHPAALVRHARRRAAVAVRPARRLWT